MGSNLGNREKNLKRALNYLEILPFKIIKYSKVYETEPLGFKSPNLFLNMALLGETSLSPWALIFEIKKIEVKMGRKPKKRKIYEDRIIDIDIIFYEDLIINSKSLIIPHPYMDKREFVILPSLELIPYWDNPFFKKTLKELCKDFKITKKTKNFRV